MTRWNSTGTLLIYCWRASTRIRLPPCCALPFTCSLLCVLATFVVKFVMISVCRDANSVRLWYLVILWLCLITSDVLHRNYEVKLKLVNVFSFRCLTGFASSRNGMTALSLYSMTYGRIFKCTFLQIYWRPRLPVKLFWKSVSIRWSYGVLLFTFCTIGTIKLRLFGNFCKCKVEVIRESVKWFCFSTETKAKKCRKTETTISTSCGARHNKPRPCCHLPNDTDLLTA